MREDMVECLGRCEWSSRWGGKKFWKTREEGRWKRSKGLERPRERLLAKAGGRRGDGTETRTGSKSADEVVARGREANGFCSRSPLSLRLSGWRGIESLCQRCWIGKVATTSERQAPVELYLVPLPLAWSGSIHRKLYLAHHLFLVPALFPAPQFHRVRAARTSERTVEEGAGRTMKRWRCGGSRFPLWRQGNCYCEDGFEVRLDCVSYD